MRLSWKYLAAAAAALVVVVGVVLIVGSQSDESTTTRSGTTELPAPSEPEPPSHVPSGNSNIFVINAASRSFKQVTQNKDEQLVADPGWSSKGEIVFGEAASGEALADLFLIDPDGSGRRKVKTPIRHLFQPTWAPDGRRVAVVRLGSGIYAIDVRSGSTRRLTRGESDEAPAWSPDGETIVFGRQLTAENPELYLVQATGGGVTRLTRDPLQQTNPSWSPDGSRILFAEQQRNGNWAVSSMKLDGSDRRRLTDKRISGQDPAWSPDGKRIAFVLQEGSRQSIAVIDADGGKPRRLTPPSLVLASSPFWSPDSKKVVFAAHLAARPPPTPAPGSEHTQPDAH